MVISSLLIASAGLRIMTSAQGAWAEINASDSFILPIASGPQSSPEQTRDRAEMNTLLLALRAREAAVEQRETDLDIRTKALDVAGVEIERRLNALEAAEKRLESTLTVAQSASEDDLARLTSVYENMKPKDASALFEAMEPEFAAGFIARMRPDTAAKVMSGLNPQAAYSISVILAGRNANAPKS
jgi:flagellar motility protein MotE (MotC chaperone)